MGHPVWLPCRAALSTAPPHTVSAVHSVARSETLASTPETGPYLQRDSEERGGEGGRGREGGREGGREEGGGGRRGVERERTEKQTILSCSKEVLT